MLVVGQGSATATVEEAATVVAEEPGDGPEIAPQNLETWIYESKGKQALRPMLMVYQIYLPFFSH